VYSLPSGAPCRALAFVSLVVCLQGLFYDPLGLSLAVQYNLASCSLYAAAVPSPRGLVSFLSSPTSLAAVQSIPLPAASALLLENI
jgi:hypothetical protein